MSGSGVEALAVIIPVRDPAMLWSAVATIAATLSAIASIGAFAISYRTRRSSRRLHALMAARTARELLRYLRECQKRPGGDAIKKLMSDQCMQACEGLHEIAIEVDGEVGHRGVAAVRALDEWRANVYRQPREAAAVLDIAIDELERLTAAVVES